MLVPTTFPKKLQHQEEFLADSFSLLVWNVHKENQESVFQDKLDELLQNYPSDFLLFQEVEHPKSIPFSLKEYSYALSSNLETKEKVFGVVTACKTSFNKIENILTNKKEIGFTTHKSAIFTQHKLRNGKPLHVVNLHAINFVSSQIFKSELLNIKRKLQKYDGAIIIAGDFNSWSSKRMHSLELFKKEFLLQKVMVNDEKNILHMFSLPIDHIFYRGLELLDANAIDTKNISDHNPIYAKFRVL